MMGDDGGTDAGPPGPTCTLDTTLVPGDVIAETENEWHFVEFPDSRCMNDTPTGIGVNLSTASPNLVLYFQGGGACFEPISCSTVANQDGFGSGKLMGEVSINSLFDRDDTMNPVRDWSFVFVPYCSGDVHSGAAEMGVGGRTQVGYQNVREYLERLVPTFADAEKILVTGSSAGGFGAALNYDQIHSAFGCDVDVTLLDDAGPPMTDMYLKVCLQSQWRMSWNLDATLPEDCDGCRGMDGGGLVSLIPYYAAKYPDRRFGLLSSMADDTIRLFYGYGYTPSCTVPRLGGMPVEEFEAGLLELRTFLAGSDNFHTFYVGGSRHTFLNDDLDTPMAGGITLREWIRQIVEDDPAWTDVGP
jgi:hypothetical protein